MTMMNIHIKHTKHQQGAVLVIALLLLLVLSLISLASVDKVSVTERIAGNERDYNSAFQAAEAALREGERWVSDLTGGAPPASGNCTSSCSTAVFDSQATFGTNTTTTWSATDWTNRSRQMTSVTTDLRYLSNLNAPPAYVIEYLGTQPIPGTSPAVTGHYFRITARATGTTANSEVILESVYQRTLP